MTACNTELGHQATPHEHVPTGYRCAVCGQPIEAEAEPIQGVYGRGYRHADNSICMANLEGDPYE